MSNDKGVKAREENSNDEVEKEGVSEGEGKLDRRERK